MRSNAFNSILTGVLAVSLVVSVIFFFQCFIRNRDTHTLGLQAATNQVNVALFQNLLSDCVAYGEKNPAIKPLLESIGVAESKPVAAPAKPATK